MAGSIADFKSSFKTDLARPNRFDVQIPIPIGISYYVGSSRLLNLRCENAELPGRNISTTSLKVYNIEEKFPYQTTYNDINLTFLVGDDLREKKLFDAWLEWINPSLNYNFKYKTDYAVSIRINQYNLENQLTYSVDLLDAFPTSVNQMDLDWSSDGVHKLSVKFEYTYWKNYSIEALSQEFAESSPFPFRTNSTLGADIPVEDRNLESPADYAIRQGA